MDVWPQRKRFKEISALYRQKEGIGRPELAVRLGIVPSSLHSLLYDIGRRPGIDLLKRAAALFGCSLTEFVDDPAAQIPGVPKEDLDRLSEAKRAVMHMMFQNLRHEDITDEQALQYLEVIESLVKAGKIRKPRYE